MLLDLGVVSLMGGGGYTGGTKEDKTGFKNKGQKEQ